MCYVNECLTRNVAVVSELCLGCSVSEDFRCRYPVATPVYPRSPSSPRPFPAVALSFLPPVSLPLPFLARRELTGRQGGSPTGFTPGGRHGNGEQSFQPGRVLSG